ncbi:MAG TPA: GAF and ANTAR domain-containing protein [Frankiaceae bacterium]|nr:GAF and ANTAR domain-containing protein [Frankiaceae bacterium]
MAEDLRISFVELQELLSETETFSGFLADLTDVAKRSFREEVYCSITLLRDGRRETAASSDDLATLADEAQYSEQTGPCLTALDEGTEVLIDDLRTETRFGSYSEKAVALGLRSVVALPMPGPDRPVGALNLYSPTVGAFSDATLTRARMLAAAASGAVGVARRITEQAQLNEDLKAAMASRRVIDQALGITMAREGCNADTAFGLLRRSSQNEHKKLREVAFELVTRTGGVPPPETPVFQPAPPR